MLFWLKQATAEWNQVHTGFRGSNNVLNGAPARSRLLKSAHLTPAIELRLKLLFGLRLRQWHACKEIVDCCVSQVAFLSRSWIPRVCLRNRQERAWRGAFRQQNLGIH